MKSHNGHPTVGYPSVCDNSKVVWVNGEELLIVRDAEQSSDMGNEMIQWFSERDDSATIKFVVLSFTEVYEQQQLARPRGKSDTQLCQKAMVGVKSTTGVVKFATGLVKSVTVVVKFAMGIW